MIAETTTDNEDSIQAVTELLSTISEKLSAEESSTETELEALKEAAKPAFVMELLAPNLFREARSDETLRVVLFLATSTSGLYLKPASQAIKSVAQQLASTTSTETSIMYVSDALLHLMVAQLSGADVEVSTNATEAIVACCKCLPPLAERALAAIHEAWKASWDRKATDKSSATTICVRCASATVELCCLSETTMASLDGLIAMLTDDSDPLLQMTTLDLLETMATTLPMHASRVAWLYSEPVLQPLLQMAGARNDPDPILGGPALRLLSTYCRLSSQNDAALFGSGNNKNQLLTLFHHALRNFNASGELDRLAVIDAISSFAAASPQALEVVLEDAVIREAWLGLGVAQPKLKAVVLHSVAMVMYPARRGDDAPSKALVTKLYTSLGQVNNDNDTSEILLNLAQSTLVELRLGAYALMEAVAKAGATQLLLLSNVYQFLLRRDVETTQEGREAKFAVILAILNSSARGLLADSVVKALEKYIEQGPHYVATQTWDVATE